MGEYFNGGQKGGNDWTEYRRLVLAELKRLQNGVESLDAKIDQFKSDCGRQFASIQSEIATLKVKAGMWGALAGVVPAAIAILVALLRT